jgi:acetyl esterase/lipase
VVAEIVWCLRRLPEESKRTGAAVVIFPGGGYTILAMGHEGRDYADWLNQRGIVAVLVKYRVSAKDEAGFQFPVPLLDARRAIRTTRAHAREWGWPRQRSA